MRRSTRWFPPGLPTRITPRPAPQRFTETQGRILPMRYGPVMPAAGLSSRFGADGPKQYAPLEGCTVIEWALAPFLADPRCAQIVVALARDDTGWMQVAARLAAPGTGSVTAVGGGGARARPGGGLRHEGGGRRAAQPLGAPRAGGAPGAGRARRVGAGA